MTRLTWSNEEKKIVAQQAAILRQGDKTLTFRDALYRAQGEVLPDNRKKKRLTRLLEQRLIKRVQTIESNPAYVHPQDPVVIAAPPPELTPPPEHPLLVAVRELGAILGAAIAKELAPHLVQAFAVKANGNGNGKNGHDTIEAPRAGDEILSKLPEKFVTHKVAVMGLLPEQQQILKKEFPHLEFRWLDGRAPAGTVRNVAKQCEAVFFMAKFISHGRQDHVPGEKRVLVNGGVSSLERLVGARYPRSMSIEPAQHH